MISNIFLLIVILINRRTIRSENWNETIFISHSLGDATSRSSDRRSKINEMALSSHSPGGTTYQTSSSSSS